MKRFIILSTARTGSNYLMNLLSGHENIKVAGEIFNLDKLSKPDLDSALENPIEYFKRKLYCDRDKNTKAIGAKVFYEHLTQDYFTKFISIADASQELRTRVTTLQDYIGANYDYADLEVKFRQTWDYLAEDESLNIIHLKRRNLLKSIVSLKRAYVTHEWMSIRDNTQPHDMLLKLDYEECLNYFMKVTRYEEKYDNIFRGHDTLEIFYEDLDANKDKVIGEVTDFLSLDAFSAFSIMKRQGGILLSEVLINYYDLKDRFENTEWRRFFEELPEFTDS